MFKFHIVVEKIENIKLMSIAVHVFELWKDGAIGTAYEDGL